VAKELGVSNVTIYACRKWFGKLEAVDVKRLRQTESENENLKKLLAERDLEIEDEGDRSKNRPGCLSRGVRSLACVWRSVFFLLFEGLVSGFASS
jgi:hypothetical protein